MKCLLCEFKAAPYFEDNNSKYYLCPRCDLIFLDPDLRLDRDKEWERYKTHKNDIHDSRYQEFVKPLFSAVQNWRPPPASGLDFGCGDGPVLGHLLANVGYEISYYDPFFHANEKVFTENYDFVIAVEVVEHLFQPAQEFKRLRELISPNGGFGLMTHFHDTQSNFAEWYYRRDPTHVCFYSSKTMNWICQNYGFSKIKICDDRTAWLWI